MNNLEFVKAFSGKTRKDFEVGHNWRLDNLFNSPMKYL
jgi:hypothetical protein